MGLRSSLADWLLSLVPMDSEVLYRLCKRVVDHHNGDNNFDMFRNGELQLMREVLPGARVVFDVGANVGTWTEEALKINSTAQYHCFEPNPAAYKFLVDRAFPANVVINNFGLGDKETPMLLFVYGERDGLSSLYDRRGLDEAARRREPVRIETLDGYCKKICIQEIDFLKLDVEGHEFPILQGSAQMLRQGRIGMIQFEYGGTYIDARVFLRDVWEYVSGVNSTYAFHKIFPSGPKRVPVYKQALETFQYSNLLIARRDLSSRQTNRKSASSA